MSSLNIIYLTYFANCRLIIEMVLVTVTPFTLLERHRRLTVAATACVYLLLTCQRCL